jgi:hypothetical protein
MDGCDTAVVGGLAVAAEGASAVKQVTREQALSIAAGTVA